MTQKSYPILEVDYDKGNIESYKGVFVTLDGEEIFRICSGTDTFFPDTKLIEQRLESEVGRLYSYGESHGGYVDDLKEYCGMNDIHQ